MLSSVPGDNIVDVNGHRNVLSLNSYEGDDENQAKELSNIISGCKQKCNAQQQSKSSPNIKERLPPQARTSSNNVNFSTINNFTGTADFYGGFPGPSNVQMPSFQSTEPQRSWKRIRAPVLSDSDED